MRTNAVYKYHIHEGNEIVFTGLKFQVCDYLKCLSIELDDAVKKQLPIGKYIITREQTDAKYLKITKPQQVEIKPKNEHERKMEYLVKHLTEYGNTVLGSIPETKVIEFIEELKQHSIQATYKKKKDVISRKPYYIIEETNG